MGVAAFVDYVRTTGPQVIDTLAAMGNAMLQIAEAGAPLGGPVLAGLEAIANIVASIVDSDLGTPLLVGVAALSLFSRGAKGLEAVMATTWGGKLKSGVQDYATTLTTVTSAQDRARLSATQLLEVEAARNRSILTGAGKGAAAVAGLTLATTGLGDSMGVTNTASLALARSMAGP